MNKVILSQNLAIITFSLKTCFTSLLSCCLVNFQLILTGGKRIELNVMISYGRAIQLSYIESGSSSIIFSISSICKNDITFYILCFI